MTTFDWTTAIAECCTHLAGLGNLPPPVAPDPALEAMAVLSLIADTPIRHALTPDSTIPLLVLPRYSGRHDLVDDLLAELTAAVAAPARGNFHKSFSARDWIALKGLDDIVLRSVKHSADDHARAQLLGHMAQRAHALLHQLARLRDRHIRQLFRRDIPELDEHRDWHTLDPNPIGWLLAHQHDGDKTRTARVTRRFQALRLYASIADTLCEPAITEAIDAGRELVPALVKRLTLTRSQLRALREAAPPESIASHRFRSFEKAALHLRAHDIPLHQWPGGGQPGQHAAWGTSPWLTTNSLSPIPADYYGTDPTTVSDAVRAFSDDLLAPLLGELKLPSASSDFSPSAIPCALTPESLPAIRQYLACVRRALVGPRGPKAFQEAAHIWHRRAAAVAALRHENQTDRPGWPPLCPPWTSPCGHYEIVPLTTAKALVEEGNAHEHCVGTYYDVCRTGSTQILSLREAGKPTVTAEILLDRRISSIRVGQFKGLRDEVPDDPALHQAMRDFLRDIRSGTHPLNRDPLRAYRQWADDHYSFGRSSRTLSIAHAREAFPLYLPLLPRRTPAEFDQWCEQTGLREGLGAALRLIPPNSGPHLEIEF
jgi:PcfJ-like protein